MRISTARRAANETRIRAAIDRLLQGDIPTGGRCDIKTLAREAGVDRTAFYGKRPYAHLRQEFEARLQQAGEAGEIPDPRHAQIARLNHEVAALKGRLALQEQTIAELNESRSQALSRLASQHDEIARLRRSAAQHDNVRRLPTGPRASHR